MTFSFRGAFNIQRNTRALIVLPTSSMAKEVTHMLNTRFGKAMSINVVNLSQQEHQIQSQLKQNRVVFVAHSNALLGLMKIKNGIQKLTQDLTTVIAEDIHLMNASYELALTLLMMEIRGSETRLIGISASLDDSEDLRKWLKINPATTFNFAPKDRTLPISTTIQTYSVVPSSAFMKALIKPSYSLIKTTAKGAILFVPTRTQCRTVASDLITRSATDSDYIGLATEKSLELEPYLDRLVDKSLSSFLLNGIGLYYAGLPLEDLTLTLELFLTGVLRAIITPKDMCWSLPVRSSTVCVLNTQYITSKPKPDNPAERSDKQIHEYSLNEVAHMQAYASVDIDDDDMDDQSREFVLMAHENGNKDLYSYFLNAGLPLESQLINSEELTSFINHQVKNKDVKSNDIINLLKNSYYGKRLSTNPTYYNISNKDQQKETLSSLGENLYNVSMSLLSTVTTE